MLAGLGNYVQERPLPTLYHGSIGAIPMGAATGIGAAGLLALGIGALWFFGVIGSPKSRRAPKWWGGTEEQYREHAAGRLGRAKKHKASWYERFKKRKPARKPKVRPPRKPTRADRKERMRVAKKRAKMHAIKERLRR